MNQPWSEKREEELPRVKSDSNSLSYWQLAGSTWATLFGRDDWPLAVNHSSCKEVASLSWGWLQALDPFWERVTLHSVGWSACKPGRTGGHSLQNALRQGVNTGKLNGALGLLLEFSGKASFAMDVTSRSELPSDPHQDTKCHVR